MSDNGRTQAGLKMELERLKHLSGLGLDLKVVWEPSQDKLLSGEIRGGSIFIYEVSLKKAVEILRHEFLDYCVSKAIEPYRMTTNNLIRSINEDAYRQKERVVEALIKILFERQASD